MIQPCGTCTSTVWKQNFAVLLPQCQNFYNAPEKFLLLCYLSSRMFLTWEIFCHSATLLHQWQNVSNLRNILPFCYSTVAECFSSEKCSATLLSQWHIFFHLINILLLCYSAFTWSVAGNLASYPGRVAWVWSCRTPCPESWKLFSCQHIDHLPKVQCCLFQLDSHSLVCFDIIHWFSSKHSRKLVTLLSETLTS